MHNSALLLGLLLLSAGADVAVNYKHDLQATLQHLFTAKTTG
jgi:hypothetical protein